MIEPALPLDLSLVPVSRRPLVLPAATERWALGRAVPQGRGRSPRVSIIIVTHGSLAVTRICLEAVLAEREVPSFEVIVVDNASTDGTLGFLDDLRSRHSAVRVIANPHNLGFAAAVNAGARTARGEVLVLLNNDVVVSPGWVERLVGLLGTDGVGMVGPVTNAAPNEARVPASYVAYGQFLEHAAALWAAHGEASFDIDVLTMFCVAMRLDVFRSVGPLDEQFGLGMFEDDDYAMRVRAAGYRLLCADGVFVHHFGEASFGALVPTGEHGRLFRRNRRLFEEKWGVQWSEHRGRRLAEYDRMTRRIREVVDVSVPQGARLAVVSKGDDALLEQGERTAMHFPGDDAGRYAGYYPADADAVINQLDDLRASGVTHLVLPQSASWWLVHYPGLESYLHQSSEQVVKDSACTIFRWRQVS